MPLLRASPVFPLVVLVTLGLFVLLGVVLVQPELVAGLLGPNLAGHISQHFQAPHHRVHDLTFSLLMGTAAVGLLAQLRTPLNQIAAQLMALVAWVVLILVAAVTSTWVFAPAPILGSLTFLATLLHPVGRELSASFSWARMNRLMLALVTIAVVPLLVFAATNIGLQRSLTNDHAALGHYGFMASFSFTVIGVGALATLRPPGWWLTSWVAGLLPVLLGLTSLAHPDIDSSLSPAWAGAAIVWGVGFVVAAEFVRRNSPIQPAPGATSLSSDTGTPPNRGPGALVSRRGTVLAVIVVVLGLLFGGLHLTGGGPGPGAHTPPIQHQAQPQP